jgi:hypothetical protein
MMGMAIREKEKWRDLGMVFKPSFKYLKNKKINFIQAILKLETLLCQNIHIFFHLILLYVGPFRMKQKKSGSVV